MSDQWRDIAGEGGATGWRTDTPPFDLRPCRQFVLVEGFAEHSGRLWPRQWADVAFVRREDQPDSYLGYRREDMERICRDGDMDCVERVVGWLPAVFPDWTLFAPTPLPSPPEQS